MHTTAHEHTWIEVSKDAVRHNIQYLMSLNHNREKSFILMVKANAYGHGLVEISMLAQDLGAFGLGVATLSDVEVLRAALIQIPIIVFSQCPPEDYAVLKKNSAETIIGDFSTLESYKSTQPKDQPSYHIKIDAGLGRFGFGENDIPKLVRELKNLSPPTGICTHYSSANESTLITENEFSHFMRCLDKLRSAGIVSPITHASNSAATAWLDENITNVVRLGLAAYGLQANDIRTMELKPALSLRTRIVGTHYAEAGSFAGYGHAWKTEDAAKISILSIGYSDGLPKSSSKHGYVLCNGTRLPIISVMMNQTLINSTPCPEATNGSVVTIIGNDGNDRISAEEVGSWNSTINEDIITSLQHNLARIFIA